MKRPAAIRQRSGMTLAEVSISTAILGILFAILFSGLITLQRSFMASSHYASSQAAQLRILDYIAMDLRRALTVATRADGGIDIGIPDYYQSTTTSDLTPRKPQLVNRQVVYGTSTIPVSYFQRGSQIIRTYNGTESVIATDVNEFKPTFSDTSKTTITLSVTFMPRFSFARTDAQRSGTSLSTTILLRNRKSAN